MDECCVTSTYAAQIFFFHHGLRGAALDEQMRSFYAHRNKSLSQVRGVHTGTLDRPTVWCL